MLWRGVEDPIVSTYLPRTSKDLKQWDSESGILPDESIYEALALDIKEGAEDRVITRVGKRLNYELPGMSSLFRKSQRRIPKLEGPPYKDAIIKFDKRWGQLETWQVIQTFSPTLTAGYFWAAMDLQVTPAGDVELQDEKRRIYIKLFIRTLYLSGVITLMTLILGYPSHICWRLYPFAAATCCLCWCCFRSGLHFWYERHPGLRYFRGKE